MQPAYHALRPDSYSPKKPTMAYILNERVKENRVQFLHKPSQTHIALQSSSAHEGRFNAPQKEAYGLIKRAIPQPASSCPTPPAATPSQSLSWLIYRKHLLNEP